MEEHFLKQIQDLYEKHKYDEEFLHAADTFEKYVSNNIPLNTYVETNFLRTAIESATSYDPELLGPSRNVLASAPPYSIVCAAIQTISWLELLIPIPDELFSNGLVFETIENQAKLVFNNCIKIIVPLPKPCKVKKLMCVDHKVVMFLHKEERVMWPDEYITLGFEERVEDEIKHYSLTVILNCANELNNQNE